MRAGRAARSPCSNALDEYLIQRPSRCRARRIDHVRRRRAAHHRASSEPVFGGVYKLAAIEDENGNVIPKIKVSENVGKITNPHFKKLYRFFGNDTGKAIADYLCVFDETVDDTKDLEIFDPEATWKRKTVYNFKAKELHGPDFQKRRARLQAPDPARDQGLLRSSRSTRSGTRSSALITRTPTMSTSRRSSGRSSMTC